MSSYERVMRGKRSAEFEDDYGDYDEDYDEDEIENYDELVDDDEESEEDEEEPDEDYVDGEPITKNIADKDDKIKREL